MFNKWFETFLSEKKLPYVQWELTDKDGVNHLIDNDMVIEAIKNATVIEKKKIKSRLVQIDFFKSDPNHFFKYLANALINNR